MSKNRENVIWNLTDGTFARGFFAFYDVEPDDGDEWDDEWDVEYLDDEFFWLAVGPTEESVSNAWKGCNPGGSSIVTRDTSPEYAERLDRIAERAKTELTEITNARYQPDFGRGVRVWG